MHHMYSLVKNSRAIFITKFFLCVSLNLLEIARCIVPNCLPSRIFQMTTYQSGGRGRNLLRSVSTKASTVDIIQVAYEYTLSYAL